jgi:hypothetical protein
MRVVSWPARTFLRILLLTVLGAPEQDSLVIKQVIAEEESLINKYGSPCGGFFSFHKWLSR